MSRYLGQGSQSPTSSPSASPRLEHYSTGRGDPLFPDIEMHLGVIFGMNSANGPKNMMDNPQIDERIQMRLKFLEDSNKVMQSRNQNLITENKALSSQLDLEAKAVNDLKSRLEEARAELETERSRSKESIKKLLVVFSDKNQKSASTESKDQMISTAGLIATIERGSQFWAVCMACQRKLEGSEPVEPTMTITKSELESLENDMQALRDAVVAREEAWDKAMEREQNYRQQLARLSAETVTARHLSDSRYSELEALGVSLVEKEAELKATQKDLLSLEKIIMKIHQRQRDIEENFDLGNMADVNLSQMSEKEQKTVEEILRRHISVRPKQRTRPKGTSSMPQSLQASPRSARTAKEAVSNF